MINSASEVIMYFLKIEADFSAALYLSNSHDRYRGMHGHDFSVSLTLCKEELSESGMVYDYKIVKNTLDTITESLDHILLNDKSEFIEKNPTVENIAKFIFDEMNRQLVDLPLYEVQVSQFKGLSAYYRPKV